MKKTLAILSLLSVLSLQVIAQSKSNLSGNILKPGLIETSSAEDNPVQLSDFSFQGNTNSNSGFLNIIQTKPGVALLSSAIIPGSGQAANKQWVRAGIYFIADVAGIIYHIDRQNKAERQEKAYEAYTHQNWSVMAYAEWLVNYSQINDLNNNWEQLQSSIAGEQPDFTNTPNDWAKVDINLLHEVERRTPFIFEGGRRSENFSHTLPKYGSQQYYELISKYYQFQPGWQDWYLQLTTNPQRQSLEYYQYMWNGQDQPFGLFYKGRDMAEEFNDNYRAAGNILKLLLVNHVVSAFDAYFTVKLKNSRIEADANLLRADQLSLKWHF